MSEKPEQPRSIRGLSPDNVWDYENAFYWFSDPTRIGKLTAHFELYKEIVDLPGQVVEFGVYKGASLVRFAIFQKILRPEAERGFLAFDAFGAFPVSGDADDQAFIKRFEGEGGEGLSVDEIKALLQSRGLAEDLELVAGDILQTLPAWLDGHADARFAMVHLDVDIYPPA